jgi:formylglycine-generating enzyme required for sulfatase activity
MKNPLTIVFSLNAILLLGILLHLKRIEAQADECTTMNGDVDGNGKIELADAVLILNYAFVGSVEELVPPCKQPCLNLDDLEYLGMNEQEYREYLHGQTGIVFVLLPGGTFQMGAQKRNSGGINYDGEARDDEGPVHDVTLSPFLISKYEVTQAQWEAVMGWNPSRFGGEGADLLPVENVNWVEIQQFEEKTGLSLPTEAQWEYACRGGTTTPFYTGQCLDTNDANYNGELPYPDCPRGANRKVVKPVGSFQPNSFGLYDMHGNVEEWCEDVYVEDFYSNSHASGPDPVALSVSGNRVIRGGGWLNPPGDCRSAFRVGSDQTVKKYNLGFRPVLPPGTPVITMPCRLPATGQTSCYDRGGSKIECSSSSYPRQDGAYRVGCAPDTRFIDNGDGTVTDTCTGLMWLKDTGDIDGDGSIGDQDRLDWQGALKYCQRLVFAGYSDWRLPNVKELLSLVDYGRFDPAIDPVFGAESWWYWSSTTYIIELQKAWAVHFIHGDADDIDKTYQLRFNIRPVRVFKSGDW